MANIALLGGGVVLQGSGAEALRVGSHLFLFPLSMHSPPSKKRHLHPQIEAALEQDGLEQVLDVGQDALWGSPGTPARDPDLSQSAASARASNGCPLPIQMQCQV